VCRTVTSVHRTGTFTRRKAGKICSWTAYVQRTSSRTEFPISFRLSSMTEGHRPEPGIDRGVPGMRRSDKAESPVLRSPTGRISPEPRRRGRPPREKINWHRISSTPDILLGSEWPRSGHPGCNLQDRRNKRFYMGEVGRSSGPWKRAFTRSRRSRRSGRGERPAGLRSRPRGRGLRARSLQPRPSRVSVR